MTHTTSQIADTITAASGAASEGLTGKTTVLRALTDLFCLRPEPSEEEVVRYSELALRILPQADSSTKVYVASKLARHGHAPPAILATLARADRVCALLIYEHALNLSAADQIGGARSRDLQCALAVARRKGVSGDITEALIMRREPDIIAALAANESATFSRSGVERIALFARHDEELVAKFSARAEEPLVSAKQFLRCSTLERARLLAAARRDRLGSPSEKIRAGSEMSLALRESAQTRNWEAFAKILADQVGLDPRNVTQLLADEGGEPLALMLCMLGVSIEDAVRIFLCCNVPIAHSYARVRALSDIVRDTPAIIAVEMLEAATGRAITAPVLRAPATQAAQMHETAALQRRSSRLQARDRDRHEDVLQDMQQVSQMLAQTSEVDSSPGLAPIRQESRERARPGDGVRPPRVKTKSPAAVKSTAVLLRRGA
jgi:uncharacterized protein (DUF2336 family)